jgi:8-oxo-dGTP pyrophosphatase MutT (NUDIX family)
MSIKKIVSHDLYGNEHEISVDQLRWRPSAYAIVIDGDKVLLTKQLKTWHLPGGGVELGELPEEAVIRETKEETGYAVANPRLVDCITGFFTFWKSQKGAHAQTIKLFYRCDLVGGEASVDGFQAEEREHGELPEWIPIGRLDDIESSSTFDWRSVVKRAL